MLTPVVQCEKRLFNVLNYYIGSVQVLSSVSSTLRFQCGEGASRLTIDLCVPSINSSAGVGRLLLGPAMERSISSSSAPTPLPPTNQRGDSAGCWRWLLAVVALVAVAVIVGVQVFGCGDGPLRSYDAVPACLQHAPRTLHQPTHCINRAAATRPRSSPASRGDSQAAVATVAAQPRRQYSQADTARGYRADAVYHGGVLRHGHQKALTCMEFEYGCADGCWPETRPERLWSASTDQCGAACLCACECIFARDRSACFPPEMAVGWWGGGGGCDGSGCGGGLPQITVAFGSTGR